MSVYTEAAYAKINRFLHVTGVREDGYHTLRTVMQSVSLCDELTYEPAGEFVFTCSDRKLETEKNLCVRAANAFFAKTGLLPVGSLHLEKRIPVGSGLGGGSSDAAAVLRLLNRVNGSPLDRAALHALAVRLGADVPFCLQGGKCLCTGIGEILQPLPKTKPEWLVIARGAEGLSTPEMYRLIDARSPWIGREPNARESGNDFEAVACERLPDISRLLEKLHRFGASEARMTGSGSAVFGVFDTEHAACLAATQLASEGFFAVSCQTVFD